MEFSFDANYLFPDTITRIVGGDCRRVGDGVTWFAEVVNKMGVASARAQGLRVPITTYQKLKSNNDTLYVLKEELEEENGKGVVVGILKVGQRKLFLNDIRGKQIEVEPLCVLDFYVHESRQRSGCGKKLFEAMMEREGVKAFEVAIDRPSSKFLGFLKKHYGLATCMKQANHYVVFPEFFKICKDLSRKSVRQLHSYESNISDPITHSRPTKFPFSMLSRTFSIPDSSKSSISGSSANNRTDMESSSNSLSSGSGNWTPRHVQRQNYLFQRPRPTYTCRSDMVKGDCLGIGNKGVLDNSNDLTCMVTEKERAPYLNMRKNTRRKYSSIAMTSYDHTFPQKSSGFVQSFGYSRFGQCNERRGGRDNPYHQDEHKPQSLGSATKQGMESSYPSRYSSQTNLKDNWKKFIW